MDGEEPEESGAAEDEAQDKDSDDEGDSLRRRLEDSITMANRPIREVFPTNLK